MARLVVLLAVVGMLGLGVARFAVAQDTPATPGADSAVCATPEASPVAAGDASPDIETQASPAVVATEVAEGIQGGLAVVVCGTPEASPPA